MDWCIASVDIISLSLGGSGSNPIIDTDGDRPSEDAAIRAVENGITLWLQRVMTVGQMMTEIWLHRQCRTCD